MDPCDLPPDDLKIEFSKLRAELDEITQQKDQAAQYGLQLIEEQAVLKEQFNQLQELFEATKHERDCAKEALGQLQVNMKTQTAVGVSFEDALLQVLHYSTPHFGFLTFKHLKLLFLVLAFCLILSLYLSQSYPSTSSRMHTLALSYTRTFSL